MLKHFDPAPLLQNEEPVRAVVRIGNKNRACEPACDILQLDSRTVHRQTMRIL